MYIYIYVYKYPKTSGILSVELSKFKIQLKGPLGKYAPHINKYRLNSGDAQYMIQSNSSSVFLSVAGPRGLIGLSKMPGR